MPNTLTPAEYRNAIYLDFEGEGKKRDGSVPMPHMAGIFKPNVKGKSGKYKSIFFFKSWKPVAHYFGKAALLIEFADYFEILTAELIANDQYLVCWSIHESMILERYLPGPLFERLSRRLHNVHLPAKQYARRKNSFGAETGSYGKKLEDYFTAIYLERPLFTGLSCGPAEACRRLHAACATHQHWNGFNERQKGYAKDLVGYNLDDCRMTWLIALKVGNSHPKISKTGDAL